MISYKNSIKILKKSIINIGDEFIKVNSCLNRVTANNIFSKVNNPAADNAAFDGFVINSKDTKNLNMKKKGYLKLLEQLQLGTKQLIKNLKNSKLMK